MIISHKYKFIFIKTEKTAGTSIEIALSKACGDSDVITPISPEDEATRTSLGHRGPQNFRIPFHRYSFRDWAKCIVRRKRIEFFNHAGAAFIQRHIEPETWNGYYKFCFERNPWDKAISWYFWNHKSEPRPSLSDFLRSKTTRPPRGLELYTIDGRVVVDKVCRYESLEEDMAAVSAHLRISENVDLPRAKGNVRADRRHYRDVLNHDDQDFIAKAHAKEIALLGYQW